MVARFQRHNDRMDAVCNPRHTRQLNGAGFSMGLAGSGMTSDDKDRARRIQQHAAHRGVWCRGAFMKTSRSNRPRKSRCNYSCRFMLICSFRHV